MKIALISDIHTGKRMYRTDENNINKYEQAGYRALDQYAGAIIARKPDILINAGDNFEVANPSVLALNKYVRFQQKIHNAGIITMDIIGNHEFSFANRKNKCTAAEIAYHDYFADYEIKTVEIDGILFVLMPYIYDSDVNINAYLQECFDIASSSTCAKKILVTHGVTEKYHRDNPLIGDKMMFSDELVELFNLVVIGHIHTPFAYKQKDTLVISPGGLIDYQSYKDRTGPCFIDTDDWSVHRELIKTPHIIKVNCNKDNINTTLENVEENMIYHISFKGDTSVINNDLFIEAKNKTINLVIEPVPEEQAVEEIKEKKLNLDFYDWVAQNYPDYNEYFNKAKEALV